MVLVLKKFVSPALVTTLLLSATFLPTVASASTTNYELANNPTEVMAEIDAMNLESLSDKMAGDARGEGWFDGLIYNATFAPVVMTAVFGSSYCTSASVCGGFAWLPWQLKPMTALSN